MMMEPYEKIIDPLINNMSSDEEKYFSIPAHKKISYLKKILEKRHDFKIWIAGNIGEYDTELREFVKKEFNWNKIAENFLKIVKQNSKI